MTDALLSIEHLEFRWPREREPVLDELNLSLSQAETVFLAGASGSGKSTLLALIGGLMVPTAGSIRLADQALETLGGAARDRLRADHVGIIFQQLNLLPWLDAFGNVRLGVRFSKRRRARVDDVDAAARQLLEAMELPASHWHRPANQLSIGQQQRVAAARALIGAPDLILADEPTSALDADRRDRFVELLFAQARAAGSAVLFVSHDRALAGRFDRQLELTALHRAGAAAC
ncbi:MAG: ABC transporter ATP-binding protein [Wenzhouxiangellaceae bacterium]|nr:ABC transporter ATP-binding protein [Wenzhouxiangellaceae bacterium]